MEKLKPCPFGGNKPITGPTNIEKYGDAWFFVKCDNVTCPPVVRSEHFGLDRKSSKQEAIKAWNKRTPPN